MHRIDPAPSKGPLRRFSYWFSKHRYNKVLDPVAVRGHHQPLLMAYGNFELILERVRRVDLTTKRLAMTKVASLVECEW